MTRDKTALLEELTGFLGPQGLISAPRAMAPFLNEPRKRFHTPALGVVRPRNVPELQELVRWANTRKVPLIPQGGNTGLVGGQVPRFGTELIVSLSRLERVRRTDGAGGFMIVEAGMTLARVHEEAERENRFFPLTLASEGTAQIGGVLSTNAGGVQVLAYGNARQLCLGLEAVLPDGSFFQGLNALKKNNTGYDLSNLLIGAEGTLGFITAASLKLFARPTDHETAWINVASPEVALELFRLLQDRAGSTLTAFELMPRFGVDIQLKHEMIAADPSASASPWYVLAEVSLFEGKTGELLADALEAAFETGLIEDATLASSLSERENMWRTREQMSESQSREGASIKHDVSVPVSAVPELIRKGIEAAEKIVPGIRPCPFGHLGDGNIHFNFTQPEGADPKAYMAGAEPVHEAIHDIVIDLGGSISAEHGIGQLKTGLLKRVKDPVALATMKKIKLALDPNNICNPGKVLELGLEPGS